MMRTRRTPVSCGANQLYGLDGVNRQMLERLLVPNYQSWANRDRPGKGQILEDLPPEIREARAKGEYDNRVYAGETVIFSDRDANENAKKLVKYIKDHELGEVTSLSTTNPNTLSKITTYLWVYNGNKLKPTGRSRQAERIVLE